MTELEFYKRITAAGLTPNQFFAAYLRMLNAKLEIRFNPDVEMRLLKRLGFFTDKGIPTDKLMNTGLFDNLNNLLIEDNEKEKSLDRKIAYYINLFPHGRLPSGAFARASVNEVKVFFLEFFETHNYSWDEIYEATKNYIEFYAQNNYTYMRNCKYFILKKTANGAMESQLALECENLKNDQTVTNSFDKDI